MFQVRSKSFQTMLKWKINLLVTGSYSSAALQLPECFSTSRVWVSVKKLAMYCSLETHFGISRTLVHASEQFVIYILVTVNTVHCIYPRTRVNKLYSETPLIASGLLGACCGQIWLKFQSTRSFRFMMMRKIIGSRPMADVKSNTPSK